MTWAAKEQVGGLKQDGNGYVSALAHPNIALVKYWGKVPNSANVPAVASLSITLDSFVSRTAVCFARRFDRDQVQLDGLVPPPAQVQRLSRFVDLLRQRAQTDLRVDIRSANNFPTGAGLASSASGFAALAVAVNAALGLRLDLEALADLTRQGSGSAARSLLGGFVQLHCRPAAAVAAGAAPTWVEALAPAAHWPLHVHVAITSAAAKAVSSTAGMERSRQTSPYYPAWLAQQDGDLQAARSAVLQRDFAALSAVAVHSCLKMHALMLAARPPLLYWNAATFAGIQALEGLRQRGLPVLYTIDAGPQLKAICPPAADAEVVATLQAVAGVQAVHSLGLGPGAQVLGADV